MPDEKASVSLELKNATEVLAVLREMRDIKRELERGGEPGGSSSGGQLPTAESPTETLATPSTSVTSLSPAAKGKNTVPGPGGQQMPAQPQVGAGAPSQPSEPGSADTAHTGPNVAVPSQPPGAPPQQPASPSSNQHPSPTPHGQQPPVASTGTSLKEIAEALGGFELYQRFTALASAGSGELGMSIAQGRPFRSASLAPELGASAITAIGSGLGFAFGGPTGMLAGAAISAPFAGMYESFAKPIADKDEEYQSYSEMSELLGYGKPKELALPAMQSIQDLWRQGYRVSPEEGARINKPSTEGFWSNVYKSRPVEWLYRSMGMVDPADDPNGDTFSIKDAKTGKVAVGGWGWKNSEWFGTEGKSEINPNSEYSAEFQKRVTQFRYSRNAIERFGGIAPENTAGYFGSLEANIWEDPLGVIAAAQNIDPKTNPAAAAHGQDIIRRATIAYGAKQILGGQEESAEAYIGLGGTQLGIASRHGSAETQKAGETQASYVRKMAGLISHQAQQEYTSGSKEKAEALMAQAAQMELQAKDFETLPGLYSRREERDAKAQLLQGHFTRAFETAELSGKSAADLPWGEKGQALIDELRLLRESMEDARKHGELSPAMKMQFENRIADTQHQLDVVLPHEKAQREWDERYLTQDRDLARMRSERTPGLLRASAETASAGTYDIELESTRKKIDLLQQELKLRQDLTAQERMSKEIQVDTLKTQEASLQAEKEIAVISARASTSYARTADERAQTQVELMRSSGGDKGLTGRMNLLTEANKDLQTAENRITQLRQAKYAEDSPEMIDARAAKDQAMIQKEQVRSDLINTPMSAKSRIQGLQLQTEGALMQMGYGSYGDVRANLQAQLKSTEGDLSELDKMKKNISKQFGWTDEDEVSYQQRRSGLVMQAAQIAEKYNEGWDQRLISEAFNTPENGRLAMSQFTHYEAALAGVVHRNFGGTETQTRGYREQTPRILAMYGSGNPSNFADHVFDVDRSMYPNRAAAIDRMEGRGTEAGLLENAQRQVSTAGTKGGAQTIRVEAPPVSVHVEVNIDGQRVPDSNKQVRITDNKSQIHNYNSARDVNVNAHEAKQPTG